MSYQEETCHTKQCNEYLGKFDASPTAQKRIDKCDHPLQFTIITSINPKILTK